MDASDVMSLPHLMTEAAPSQPPALTPRWFALWTRSRHERAVFDQLTDRGIEAFLPTTPRRSRWKDRTKKVDWPLFPGYCFARFAPASRLPVLKCAGVVSVVSFDGELAPVPDEAIEGIRTLVNSALPCDPCPLLNPGMKVEMVHGPLKGLTGYLERKGAHARLVLSLDLIGRGVSVQVDAADVRAL